MYQFYVNFAGMRAEVPIRSFRKIIPFSSLSFCHISFLSKFCNMYKRFAIVLFLSIATLNVYSQCAVCRTTISSSADKESAKGLNGGILYLAAMPLVFMGFIGYKVWRQNKD